MEESRCVWKMSIRLKDDSDFRGWIDCEIECEERICQVF